MTLRGKAGAFGAGPRALERRNHTLQALEQMIQAGRTRAWNKSPVDLTVKFLIGGIREVSVKRLRGGRAEELPELADELGAWANAHPVDAAARPRRARAACAGARRRDRLVTPERGPGARGAPAEPGATTAARQA